MVETLQRVLLVGAGRFGKNYIRILSELDKYKQIIFSGIVVTSEESAQKLRDILDVKVYSTLTDDLLINADAVIIVTPPETHYEIATHCLKFCDVMVEKPLAENTKDIDYLSRLTLETGHILTVAHIYRFHSVTKKLQEIVSLYDKPLSVRGSFINPLESDQGRPVSIELLHLFDVIDTVWQPELDIVSGRILDKRLHKIDIRYKDFCDTHLTLGWSGINKVRNLICDFSQVQIVANFESGTIEIIENGNITVITCKGEEPLSREIKSFLQRDSSMVGADVARGIVNLANLSAPQKINRPRVAIIGAGLFGLNIAFKLDSFCDVTVYERNNQILNEGAKVNQYRHHAGYHYPRSDETVFDVQQSHQAFELLYKEALVYKIPTYYAVAKEGSHTNPTDFLSFCNRNKLPYKKVDKHKFNPDLVSLVVEVVEPSYHFDTLKKLHQNRIEKLINTQIELNSEVIKADLCRNGSKDLVVRKANKTEKHVGFDFVINTTYAYINNFTRMLNFRPVSIRIDLTEVLIVNIPIDPISLTVIDGPFATLMPTGNLNEFTLYHVTESILDRYTPEDGLVHINKRHSNSEEIFKQSSVYFPQLEKAKILESRIVHRGVQAHREHDDNRVAEIFDHGFGCWSILSGKIVSSVKIAENIESIIRTQAYQ